MNERQKRFCELYSSSSEFFCNGVQSYIEAYKINTKRKGAYNAARTSAYELLTNPDILAYIDKLLETKGLNDTYVDKQLEKMITQDADFGAKIAAIKEYNQLKKRITQKLEHSGVLLINDLHAAANTSVGAGGVSGKTKTSTPNSPTT